MIVAGVKDGHEAAVTESANIGESFIAAGTGVFTDERIIGRGKAEFRSRGEGDPLDGDIADANESLAAVEPDASLLQIGIPRFKQNWTVQGDPQEISDTFDLGGMPFPGGLVEVADPFDFIPTGVAAVTDENRLIFIEVDVVVVSPIDGTENKTTSQNPLILRLHEEFGSEGNIGVFVRGVKSGGQSLATIENEFVGFQTGSLVREGPLRLGLRRRQIARDLSCGSGTHHYHEEEEE